MDPKRIDWDNLAAELSGRYHEAAGLRRSLDVIIDYLEKLEKIGAGMDASQVKALREMLQGIVPDLEK